MGFFEVLLYTFFITPVIFIVNFIAIIHAIHNNEDYRGKLIACSVSFWLMIVPTFFVVVNAIS